MSFDLPVAERKLRSTERLVYQGMWLLFLISAALMVVVRRSAVVRTGSIWILCGAVAAFMISFALRDVVRKLVRRNTEDKIVKDVKSFLERQPALAEAQPAQPKIPVGRANTPASDAAVPLKPAGFLTLKDTVAYRASAGDPVVFDAFPARESAPVKTHFFAVLLPVLH